MYIYEKPKNKLNIEIDNITQFPNAKPDVTIYKEDDKTTIFVNDSDIGEGGSASELWEDSLDLTDVQKEQARTNIGAISKQDITSVIHVKGSVETYSNLPTSGQEIGDMYNVLTADPEHGIAAGDNVVWTENGWDNFSGLVSVMTGATSSSNGTSGLVPAPAIADKDRFLKGNGTWVEIDTNPLPEHSLSDEGKSLMINSNNALTWDRPVPNYTLDDVNKVLTVVDESGPATLTWQAVSSDGELPEYSSQDAGKILMVDSHSGDSLTWSENPVPDYRYNHAGEVLTITEGYGDHLSLAWQSVLPSYSDSGDEGKVLTIGTDDSLSWENPLPSYDDSNVGQVLTVINQTGVEPGWTEVLGLPSYSSASAGQVLTLADGSGLRPEWKEIIPPYDNAEEGMVLTVNSRGALEWRSI